MAKFQPIIQEQPGIEERAAILQAAIQNQGISKASVTVGSSVPADLAGQQVAGSANLSGGTFEPGSNAKQASAGGQQV